MNKLKHASAAALLAAAALLMSASAQAGSTNACGGNGSSQTTTLRCPAGQYVVGLSARGGSYVDKIGVRCAAFNGAGRRQGQGTWSYGGSSGGSNGQNKSCDASKAVLALDVKSGSYVDRIGKAYCGDVASGFSDPKKGQALAINVGGSGGATCRLGCPPGEALYQLKIWHGSWIDRIAGMCRP